MAVVLAVIGWVGVVVAMNFHSIVPHASPAEIRPFLVAAWLFALLMSVLAIKSLATKPKP